MRNLLLTVVVVYGCFCLTAAALLDLYEGNVCKTVRGVRWSCKKLAQCQGAIQALQSGGRPDICSFQGSEPVVCCEPNRGTTTGRPISKPQKPEPPKPPPRPPISGQKASKMCMKYAEYVYISIGEDFFGNEQKENVCSELDALIVGGNNSRPREFPHMAQIGFGEKTKIDWACGGSLISKNFVLGAAHCATYLKRPAGWVKLGDYDQNTNKDEETGDAKTEVVKISETIVHPDYNTARKPNDIALFRLARDVEFNEFIRPVCLQTETSIQQSYATAIGWGDTDYGGPASAILQKVNLTLISSRSCSSFYKPQPDLPDGIKGDSMMCAGDTFSNKDTCQRDSGGPLQVKHPNLYCMYNQVGITSFGVGCALQPGVYTRVSHFVPWIETIVWK